MLTFKYICDDDEITVQFSASEINIFAQFNPSGHYFILSELSGKLALFSLIIH